MSDQHPLINVLITINQLTINLPSQPAPTDDGILGVIQEEVLSMTKQLDDLKVQVANTTTVEDSAVAMIQGLSEQIAALKDDPAALQSLSDSLSAKSAALAKAIADNTPAADTPPADTPPADTPPADTSGDVPVGDTPVDDTGDAPVSDDPTA